jgi:glyoxylase-like metal-dependent hydrolase (beta-lactamase superfamily II)
MYHRLDASTWRYQAHGLDLLFDAGAGVGPLPTEPERLFLTHGHADHSGGAGRLAVPTSAGMLTSTWLREGRRDRISLDVAIAAGIYPPDYRLEPIGALHGVGDGEIFEFGPVTVTAIATPGHSADHTCWLVTSPGSRVLVGGDVLFEGGTVILQNSWDCSVRDSSESVLKVIALAPDVLLPGHGAPLFGDSLQQAFDAARERINRFLPPLMWT